jgi:hypothetical protein
MGKMLEEERFKHVSYSHTDISETFKRERKRLARIQAEQEGKAAELEAERRKAEEAEERERREKVRPIAAAKAQR